MNKMSFTMKTQLFLWILLALLLTTLAIFGVFSQMLKDDLYEVEKVNVNNSFKTLSLLDELGDMQGNILDYLTGEEDEIKDFEANYEEFLGFVNGMNLEESEDDTIATVNTISTIASNYKEKIETVFILYNPIDERASISLKQELLQTSGVELETLLEKLKEEEVEDALRSDDFVATLEDDIPGIVNYAELVDESGDLLANIEEYLMGVDGIDEQFELNSDTFLEALNNLKPLETTSADIVNLDRIESLYNEIYTTAHYIFDLYDPAAKAQAFVLVDEIEHDEFRRLETLIDDFALENQTKVGDRITNINKSINMIITIMFVLLIVAVLVAVISAIFIKRLALEPIKNVSIKMYETAANISSASNQFAQSSKQLAQGSNNQAASIEETSASMEETSTMVWQSAENTKSASNLSAEAMLAAKSGFGKMDNMRVTMEELKQSSDDIANIIKVIDNIAFQTNMLALNAAVEAARAGDAGQGFAVVAEEVRNLAQRSAQAAKDTAVIIEKNIVRSQQGVSVSEEVSKSLNEINIKVEKVNNLIAEIASTSEEQSKGVQQVTTAMSSMERVVQQNASVAEQSASSALDLRNQANELEEVVKELNYIVKGGSGSKYDNQMKTKAKALSVQRSIFTEEEEKEFNKANNQTMISAEQVIPFNENDDF